MHLDGVQDLRIFYFIDRLCQISSQLGMQQKRALIFYGIDGNVMFLTDLKLLIVRNTFGTIVEQTCELSSDTGLRYTGN